MNGVSIVETETLLALINRVKNLEDTMVNALTQLSDSKKPYLSSNEVIELTGFSKTWLNENKQHIGFSTVGGSLRFKRKDVEAFMEANYYKSKKS